MNLIVSFFPVRALSALSIFLVLSPANFADERTKATHYAGFFYGQSLLVLGSEDRRTGGGFSYAFGRPEPRFQLRTIPAQLVYEAYTDRTWSSEQRETFGYGGLAYSRWRWPISRNQCGVYFDLGVGLQYANRTTVDLDSRLNSTPMAGIGVIKQFGSQEFMYGLRFLHISNAGFVKPNQGQNQLFFTVTVRY